MRNPNLFDKIFKFTKKVVKKFGFLKNYCYICIVIRKEGSK